MHEFLTGIAPLLNNKCRLIAISKTHNVHEIKKVYDEGVRDFGENKVQELIQKAPLLPNDIHWHLVGHLQTNKVKQIAPFISMIHSIDSYKLLQEVNKQAEKNNRIIDCVLQIYIAKEETKFGLDREEAEALLTSMQTDGLKHVRITGLMGIATFTDNADQVREEFKSLKSFFDKLKITYFAKEPYFKELSMGMSGDYTIAIEEGSTMIRIGTAIFGERDYSAQK